MEVIAPTAPCSIMEHDMYEDTHEVIERWRRAFDASDAKAMAALYTQDAIFIGGLGGPRLGQAGVFDYFDTNVPDGRSRIAFRDFEIRALRNDVRLVAMLGTITRDGGDPRDFRFIQTHVRQDGAWRIAGHHGSGLIPQPA